MANFAHIRGKGRGTEWAERVNANDPVNAVFVFAVLATAGIEADAVLEEKDTFADVVAGTTNFVTNAGYAAKVIDQTGGVTIVYDDTNNRTDVDVPDQTWVGIAAGDGWNDVISGYDSDSTGGTDANILPLTQHDFVATPDGSDITAQIAVFHRAT